MFPILVFFCGINHKHFQFYLKCFEVIFYRDAIAYMRCVAQPADDLAFERIVNTPRRGLGDATLHVLHDYGRKAGVPLIQAARALIETEEMKARPRTALKALIDDLDRWRGLIDVKPQHELAEMVLDESGYTEMWRQDKTPEAAGRLENLKELVRAMEEFPDLAAFLEHVSLVMEAEEANGAERVSIMTLHGAKGLEFETVYLPGWEEGLFPHQRSLDEQGRAGLEEERRLAYVGVTRAKRRAKIFFASNRRIRGLWQPTTPSRFIDNLPSAHVDVVEAPGGSQYGAYGVSRFATFDAYDSDYASPGWTRARARAATAQAGAAHARQPKTIEGEVLARSSTTSRFRAGTRVFHQKFGPGTIAAVDGGKLTVDFDKAGRKMVLESFVQAG